MRFKQSTNVSRVKGLSGFCVLFLALFSAASLPVSASDAIGEPFYLAIEYDFMDAVNGETLIVGRSKSGLLTDGETVSIYDHDGTERMKGDFSRGHQPDRRAASYTGADSDVPAALYVRGVEKIEIMPGMVVARPGTLMGATEFKAVLRLPGREEGGRLTPFHHRSQIAVDFWGAEVAGLVDLSTNPGSWGLAQTQEGQAGDVAASIRLIVPVAMNKGLRFAIREGGKTIGAGQVIEIIK